MGKESRGACVNKANREKLESMDTKTAIDLVMEEAKGNLATLKNGKTTAAGNVRRKRLEQAIKTIQNRRDRWEEMNDTQRSREVWQQK